MTRPSSPREFEMKIDIAAPRAAVWKAITTDTELRRWFPPEAEVSPGVGGEVLWRWNEHFSWPQQIEIWEPESRLRTRYDSTVEDGGGGRRPLFVDFLLEGEGGRTTLRLVQSGFGPEAAFDHEYDGISRGWPVELRSLRLYLEQHAGKDRRLAWAKTAIRLDADEAWRRLTADDGLACGALGSFEGSSVASRRKRGPMALRPWVSQVCFYPNKYTLRSAAKHHLYR